MDSSDPASSLAVLGLGSNRGDGEAIFQGAAAALGRRLSSLRLSSFYTSSPMYVLDQPRFLNAAISGVFSGTPHELLGFVQEVEAEFGRNRRLERRKGERTLDIDILLFGSLVIDEPPLLTIPHEGLLERKFALLPLLELIPDSSDPRTGTALSAAFEKLPDQGIYYANLRPYNGRYE